MLTLNNSNYLLIVDYLSRYVVIAQLVPTWSADVVVYLKSVLARHGIPETLIADNGPQFTGRDFAAFAVDDGISHVTSSPKHPQSNWEASKLFRL